MSAESVRVAVGETPLRSVDFEAELDEPSSGRRVAGRLARRPLAWIGGSIVVAAVLVALAAPLIAGDPLRQDMSAVLAGPTARHPFGVDDVGRDVWSRVVWGARISLSVGLVSVTIALLAGVSLGLAAGYAGGRIDDLVMRGLDVLLSFPTLVLALAITASLGPGITNTMIAVGIVSVPRYARVVRGQVLSLREQLFVLAAQGLGASALRVCLRHILPNVVPSLIVLASLSTAGAILAEASLSFLGLGVQPPAPSWGSMLDRGRDYLDLAPWIAIAPGVAIFATVLGFNFLGDALRDALDPRIGD